MIAPRPVPAVPEIGDIDEWEMLQRHVVAYDALAGLVMVLSGAQSGDIDEWVIEKAMTEARHAADGITTALQELGYKYGVSSVREVLYDWKGKQDRVA